MPLYVGEDARGWTHCNDFFDMNLSSADQHPVLSHPECPQGSPVGWLQWLIACWQASCSQRESLGAAGTVTTHPLFTDAAGNIFSRIWFRRVSVDLL